MGMGPTPTRLLVGSRLMLSHRERVARRVAGDAVQQLTRIVDRSTVLHRGVQRWVRFFEYLCTLNMSTGVRCVRCRSLEHVGDRGRLNLARMAAKQLSRGVPSTSHPSHVPAWRSVSHLLSAVVHDHHTFVNTTGCKPLRPHVRPCRKCFAMTQSFLKECALRQRVAIVV